MVNNIAGTIEEIQETPVQTLSRREFLYLSAIYAANSAIQIDFSGYLNPAHGSLIETALPIEPEMIIPGFRIPWGPLNKIGSKFIMPSSRAGSPGVQAYAVSLDGSLTPLAFDINQNANFGVSFVGYTAVDVCPGDQLTGRVVAEDSYPDDLAIVCLDTGKRLAETDVGVTANEPLSAFGKPHSVELADGSGILVISRPDKIGLDIVEGGLIKNKWQRNDLKPFALTVMPRSEGQVFDTEATFLFTTVQDPSKYSLQKINLNDGINIGAEVALFNIGDQITLSYQGVDETFTIRSVSSSTFELSSAKINLGEEKISLVCAQAKIELLDSNGSFKTASILFITNTDTGMVDMVPVAIGEFFNVSKNQAATPGWFYDGQKYGTVALYEDQVLILEYDEAGNITTSWYALGSNTPTEAYFSIVDLSGQAVVIIPTFGRKNGVNLSSLIGIDLKTGQSVFQTSIESGTMEYPTLYKDDQGNIHVAAINLNAEAQASIMLYSLGPGDIFWQGYGNGVEDLNRYVGKNKPDPKLFYLPLVKGT